MNQKQKVYLVAHALNMLPSMEDVEQLGELIGKCCARCCAPCNALFSLIKSNEINTIFKDYYQDNELWANDWDWWNSERSEFDTDYFFARVHLNCGECSGEYF